MPISNAQRAKINKMNKASQAVSMGTIIQDLQSGCAVQRAYLGMSGSTACTGSQVVISTGMASIKGYVVQNTRSGSVGTIPLYVWSGSVAGTLVVTSASGANALTTSDKLTYFVY